MDQFFLESKFELIHLTSEVTSGYCKTCGDNSEHWVKGKLKGKKYSAVYSYPDLNQRGRFKCSKCFKPKTKVKKVCKVVHKKCEECEKSYVSRPNKSKYCNIKCRNKANNKKNLKKYDLACDNCGESFVHNKHKKFCSKECEVDNRSTEVYEKVCKTCNSTFKAKGNVQYCKDSCSPYRGCYNPPKKERNCISCENKVISPVRKCEDCKKKGNKSKKKEVEKECPTCNIKFKTSYSSKIYCKPNHSSSSKLAKKLRKRAKIQARLDVETWDDIRDFIKTRPEGMHLDHIIPLNHPDVCGLHNTWNFQWLTPEENLRKSNRLDHESQGL